MDFSAFSDGQIKSKLWLCEKLEPYLRYNSKIAILGSWYNILGFMLLNRKPNHYQLITGFDMDPKVKEHADLLNAAYVCYPNKLMENVTVDVNQIDVNDYDCIISTSVEHMESLEWFSKLNNKLVCIQSSNVTHSDEIWDIKNSNPTFNDFKNKFQCNKTYFEGQLEFNYGHLAYNRYMIIGQTNLF